MKKKMRLLASVLAAVLVFGGIFVLYDRLSAKMDSPNFVQESSAEEELPEDYPLAPDFTVLNREGEEVKLSDLAGKPVVLNFWASWCGPCKMEMPDFQLAYEKYGEAVHFMMVNLTDGMRETMDGASAFVDAQGYTFPVYFDTRSEAAMNYGVMAIPTTYFINAEGRVIAHGASALDLEIVEQGIGMILK